MNTKTYNLQCGETVKDFLLNFKTQPLMWFFIFGIFCGIPLLFQIESPALKTLDYAYILINTMLLVMLGLEG